MSSLQSKKSSNSIKVVPGRSKLRVESSNPVPTGNPNRKLAKVKLISPQEAMKLPSGASPMAVSPISKSSRPVLSRRAPETPTRPVLSRPTPEATRPVLTHSDTCRKEIVCGLPSFSSMNARTLRQRTNPSLLQPKTFESPPLSPRALQIRSRVKQQGVNATQEVVEEIAVEVCDRAKDHCSKETCGSSSDERVSELLLYRPALHPIWKGRIVDSARLPEFDCEFLAKLASNIRRKALRLSKAMPTLLKVELLPTGHILNDVFERSPKLSDVDIYLFPDEMVTERFKGEHEHLFEAMVIRNAMIRANVNGTELLIFSATVSDKTSQFFINTQKKTEHFLWGCFLQTRSSQTDKDLDDEDAIDMDLDTDYLTPSLAHKLMAESQSIPSSSPVKSKTEVSLPPGFENPSRSPEKAKEEVSLPPGFEKIWSPPLVKLNIHGTSNTDSALTGSAGLVRNQSGKWLFGYSRYHTSLSEVAAGLLAIHHGLKLLWDTGYRRIRLETTNIEIIEALTTKSSLFRKEKSILGSCKALILKEWEECDIYLISKEQNSCAEWLANRFDENQPQGLVFYEYPPRRLVNLLEKDVLASKDKSFFNLRS